MDPPFFLAKKRKEKKKREEMLLVQKEIRLAYQQPNAFVEEPDLHTFAWCLWMTRQEAVHETLRSVSVFLFMGSSLCIVQ